MAIPICYYSPEETEDPYRFHALILRLLELEVLAHQRREAAANAHSLQTHRYRNVHTQRTPLSETRTEPNETREQPTTNVSAETTSPSFPLPDLVLNNSSQPTQEEEKESDRTGEVIRSEPTQTNRVDGDGGSNGAKRTPEPPPTGTCRLSQKTNEKEKEKAEKETMKTKEENNDVSLLSFLYGPLRGSVWTTVAILLGWGLLYRR